MYAVIKTGGKQYRVQAGDVLVVEKLPGDAGSEVSFDQVLMLGGEGGVTVGAPLVEGALVRATLIETRRGEKIKVLKKIRRQGYRRTNGHRQGETGLRVTGLEGAGQSAKWDGTVDLTTRAVMNARARGLAPMVTTAEVQAQPAVAPAAEPTTAAASEAAAPKRARKASPAPATDAMVEQPVGETPDVGAQTAVDPAAASETGSMASAEAAPKTPRAKKAAPAAPDAESASDAALGDGE